MTLDEALKKRTAKKPEVSKSDAEFCARRLLRGLGLTLSGLSSAEEARGLGYDPDLKNSWERAVRLWEHDNRSGYLKRLVLTTPHSPSNQWDDDIDEGVIAVYRSENRVRAVYSINSVESWENFLDRVRPPFFCRGIRDGERWAIYAELEDVIKHTLEGEI